MPLEHPILIRVLSATPFPTVGSDVDGAARALHRYLGTGNLGKHDRSRQSVRETFGPAKAQLAREARRVAGLPAGWQVTPALDRVLRKASAYDLKAEELVAAYNEAHLMPVLPTRVYPHPLGARSSICQGVHPTAGLPGNIALDFCAPGGTYVLAPVDCEIVKVSGHNPAAGEITMPDGSRPGIFGYNVHFVSRGGYRWFSTHYGLVVVRVGQKLKRGDAVGLVGHWPNDPGRSHSHIGVTSQHGVADATTLIRMVGAAPRVPVPA